MKTKLISMIASLALFGTVSTVQASPIDVSYTVSGSAGNWVFDFAITNNLGGTNRVYAFGVRLTGQDYGGIPVGWTENTNIPGGVNWFNSGGSATNYNNNWITCPTTACPVGHPLSDIDPGQSLGGFQVLESALTLPAGVSWYAIAAGGTYMDAGCSFNCTGARDNPGFEGLAVASVVSPISLPGALSLFAIALALFAGISSRRMSAVLQAQGICLAPK